MLSALAFEQSSLEDAAGEEAPSDTAIDDAADSTQVGVSLRVRALERVAKRFGPRPPSYELDIDHSTEEGQDQPEKAPILDFPQVLRPRHDRAPERFVALQEWEGYIVRLEKATFTATLRDVTAGATIEEEEAEFPLDDIAEADADLVGLGAVFRWIIGYETKAGTRKRVSQIVFRRLPQWTKRDIERAKQRAAELADKVEWE